MAIDGQSGEGLVRLEQTLDRAPRLAQRGIVERPSVEDRCVAGGEQQRVPVAQRDVELRGESEHHLAARCRTTRFHEAQMPLRDATLERECELAESPTLAPLTHERAERRVHDGELRHGIMVRRRAPPRNYVARN